MADPLAAAQVAQHRTYGRRRRRAFGWLALGLLAGCQERLTAPGQCPEFCPGGQLTVTDTVLTAVPGGDSSFVGYFARGAGEALLVSNGLQASEDRAIVRFARRRDSININGVLRAYTIDSAAFDFTVRARDSMVDGLRVILYRLPITVDTATTFAEVEALLIDANLIDTVAVADTLLTGTVHTVLPGSELARVSIPEADSGVLALGMRIVANAPTGLRIASIAIGSPAIFTTYVTADIEDPALRPQLLISTAAFNTFVSQGTPALDNDRLAVGGEPSARALLRFEFPPRLRDSVSIVRATLELVPAVPLFGLANDPTTLEARPILADLGAKSPLCLLGSVCGGTVLTTLAQINPEIGSSDTVRIEVPQVIRSWQGLNPVPTAMLLMARPEAATFMRPVFFSTRSGVGMPRIRISYVPLSFVSP